MGFKINLKDKVKKSFASIPAGRYLAQVTQIIEIGTQFANAPGSGVFINFWVDGKSHIHLIISESYMPRSKFMKFLYAVSGGDTEEEIDFQEKLRQGLFMYVVVQEGKKGYMTITDFDYANGDRLPKDKIYPLDKTLSLSLDEVLEDVDKVPIPWLRKIIARSIEYQQRLLNASEKGNESDKPHNEESNEEKADSKEKDNKDKAIAVGLGELGLTEDQISELKGEGE